MSEQDVFAKWAAEVQRLRMEHEAVLKRETAKAFHRGRQSVEKAPTSDWVWRGGQFRPPPHSSPENAPEGL